MEDAGMNELWIISDTRILDRRLGAWWEYANGKLFVMSFDNLTRYEITDNAAGMWNFLKAQALDARKGY